MLLETAEVPAAMSWPFLTISPFFTKVAHGAPMCCLVGMTTFAGGGGVSMGLEAVASFRYSGCIPHFPIPNI
jgi:hypothetical protein